MVSPSLLVSTDSFYWDWVCEALFSPFLQTGSGKLWSQATARFPVGTLIFVKKSENLTVTLATAERIMSRTACLVFQSAVENYTSYENGVQCVFSKHFFDSYTVVILIVRLICCYFLQ
jgi:hypothetical protein